MKVTIRTFHGDHTIEGVNKIVELEDTIILACGDNREYNLSNDYPTMHRLEVEPND